MSVAKKQKVAGREWKCQVCLSDCASEGRTSQECPECNARYDSLSERLKHNTKENRDFFESLGFYYFPNVLSESERGDPDKLFSEEKGGVLSGGTRKSQAAPFAGKGFVEATLQSKFFENACQENEEEGEENWSRTGPDAYKNSVPEVCQCWHQGTHKDPADSKSQTKPRPELSVLVPRLLEKLKDVGWSKLDSHVPDKETLYLVQVVKYDRGAHATAADVRGAHMDNITNAAHIIVGYTGGPTFHSRYMTLSCGDREYTHVLEPGSVYIMKDASRYGNKLRRHMDDNSSDGDSFYDKVYHEPFSLFDTTCYALVFRFGTVPQKCGLLDCGNT